MRNSHTAIAAKQMLWFVKWSGRMNKYFSEEDIQMSKRYINKTHQTAIIRRMNNKHWQRCGGKETAATAVKELILTGDSTDTYRDLRKIKNRSLVR